MKKCVSCGEQTPHKKYMTGVYKYEGQRVEKCKFCGHLRTEERKRVVERNMIHIPTQTKRKNMGDGE